jgi:hypothetical protein
MIRVTRQPRERAGHQGDVGRRQPGAAYHQHSAEQQLAGVRPGQW